MQGSPFLTRRQLLLGGSAVGLTFAGYSAHRGVRFPRLSLEPTALPQRFTLNDLVVDTQDLILTPSSKISPKTSSEAKPRFRAYAPEPKIVLRGKANAQVSLIVNNIAASAQLRISNSSDANTPPYVSETAAGITRELNITLPASGELALRWHLPIDGGYSFASIGDTGGDQELAWCLQRAADLNALFLLHLGDFNYQPGDYDRSITLFDNAQLPVYVSIGNHDFHESGLLYDKFRSQIGPLNNSFKLGKTRFINVDTAANTLPFNAGHRGELLASLRDKKNEVVDTVAFTHRPVHDPLENSDHDIGSAGERDWLVEALKEAGANMLLSGHIHIYNRGSYHGIENIIIGQGLGHQDLIVNRDYSKILIGDVNPQGKINYRPEPLAMPMRVHCHPRSDVVKQSLVEADHYSNIQAIDEACSGLKG